MRKPIVKNDTVRLLSACTVAAACLSGILLNIFRDGAFNAKMLTYYTVLSNMVMLASCAVQIRARSRSTRGLAADCRPWFTGFALLTLTLTAAVMTSILIPVAMGIDTGMDFTRPGSLLAHYIVPALAITDWALMFPHGKFRAWYPLTWLAAPAGYFLLSLVFAQCGVTYGSISGVSRFAYFFVDVDALGWPRTLLHTAAIGAGCLAAGYTYWFFDNIGRWRSNNKNVTKK